MNQYFKRQSQGVLNVLHWNYLWCFVCVVDVWQREIWTCGVCAWCDELSTRYPSIYCGFQFAVRSGYTQRHDCVPKQKWETKITPFPAHEGKYNPLPLWQYLFSQSQPHSENMVSGFNPSQSELKLKVKLSYLKTHQVM